MNNDIAIVEGPRFEDATVKVQKGLLDGRDDQQIEVVHTLRPRASSETAEQTQVTLTERSLHNYNVRQFCKEHFIDSRFIVASKNIVKRLFLVCRYARFEYRNRVWPANFETRLF